eukprot:1194871-Prorocentrum_minimum.AAC.7
MSTGGGGGAGGGAHVAEKSVGFRSRTRSACMAAVAPARHLRGGAKDHKWDHWYKTPAPAAPAWQLSCPRGT